MLRRLSEADCRAAIREGDFLPGVAGAAPRVAVVLTQSWCPQWVHLRSRLEALPAEGSPEVFWVEYDLEPFFDEFMAWKEDALGNREVPYVRYYRDGRLVATSNYVDQRGFLDRFGR